MVKYPDGTRLKILQGDNSIDYNFIKGEFITVTQSIRYSDSYEIVGCSRQDLGWNTRFIENPNEFSLVLPLKITNWKKEFEGIK